MENVFIGIIIVPGIFALLFFFVFSYLYRQSHEPYFRAWQLAWAAYCLQYALLAWNYFSTENAFAFIASKLLFCGVAAAILVSTRLVQEDYRPHWSDAVLAAGAVALTVHNLLAHMDNGRFQAMARPHLELDVGIAFVLALSAARFYRLGRQRDSAGFRLLAASLLLWVPLLVLRQFHGFFDKYFGRVGLFLGTMPQMLVGVAMIIVLFEHERRLVQENALVFSTLDVDANSLLSPAEAAPALLKLLDRFMRLCRAERAAISIAERWRAVLPSVSRGFDPTFTAALENEGAGEYLSDIAFRRGGLGTLRNVAHMTEPLPAGAPRRFERCQAVLGRYEVRSLTAVSLQTREHNFGVVLFPHDERRVLGTSQVRLLLGVAMQIGLTLENYVVMNEAKRRTREYELLTQMGQVISSRLDSDEVLRSIQKELGLLFDTETFYVAFLADDELRFEFESVKGEVLPKRSRKTANAMTEYVIRSGQPLLVRSDMEKVRARLGLTFVPDIPAKSYCAAPIFINNHAVGVLAVMNFDREFVYEQRDLELLQTAAGQVAVAIENARLFKEQQRRSRYLAFLNNVSKAAISSQDAERMLAEIALRSSRTSISITSASACSITSPRRSRSRPKRAPPPPAPANVCPWAPASSDAAPAAARWCWCRTAMPSWPPSCPTRAPCSACRLPMARACSECSTSRAAAKKPLPTRKSSSSGRWLTCSPPRCTTLSSSRNCSSSPSPTASPASRRAAFSWRTCRRNGSAPRVPAAPFRWL